MRILVCQATLKKRKERKRKKQLRERETEITLNSQIRPKSPQPTLTFLWSRIPGVTRVTKKMQPLVLRCGGIFCILQICNGPAVGTRKVLTLFGEDTNSQGVTIILMLWVTRQQFHRLENWTWLDSDVSIQVLLLLCCSHPMIFQLLSLSGSQWDQFQKHQFPLYTNMLWLAALMWVNSFNC